MKLRTYKLSVQDGKLANSLVMKFIALLLVICGLSAVPLAAQTSWKGTTSTNWSTASNWTNGVPTASLDAIIGDANFTGANQPDLSATSYCKSLTIGNGTKVSAINVDRTMEVSQDIIIGSNGTLTHSSTTISIQGNWYNSGNYNASQDNSFVTFNGTMQSINGTSSFRNLTINQGSATTLNGNVSVTKTFSVNGTFDPGINLVTLSGGITFPVATGAILKVKGATFASNYSRNPTLNARSVVDYASSSINQTVSVQNYGTLKISGGTVKTLAGNLTLQSSASDVGNVSVTEGTFNLTTYSLSRGTSTSGGSITIDNNATLKIGGTTSFPTRFSTILLQPTSTVDYIGTTQVISPQNYGNLTISAGASAGRSVTLSSTGTIGVYSNYTPSTINNVYTLTGSTVSFNGISAQTIGATFATNFNNLIIANGSTVTLNSNTSIAGNLTVSNGTFDLGAFTANRTTSGGALTVSNNATLKIGGTNTFPSNYSLITLVVASMVEYSGTNQTVASTTYGNLKLTSSSGAAVKTLPAVALTIIGNLVSSVGTGTSVSFTATSTVNVNGNVSIGASTTFNGGNSFHTIGGNWTNDGTFYPSTGTIKFAGAGALVGGSGTLNFYNLAVSASNVIFSNTNIIVSSNLSTSESGSFSQVSGGTVTMTGSGKAISGLGISFENLVISGSITSFTSFTITGNLLASGSFSSTGTVTMSGASKTISGAEIGFSTLFISGSVTTVDDFSISSALSVNGSFAASAGTITFTGTSVLSGSANLFNININGTSLQLSTNSTLGIANTMTLTAGTLNVTSTIPNTVNFNSSAAQNINAITYNNLVLSNGGIKTAIGNITTKADLTIGSGTTFRPSSYTHSIYGSWVNNGTFTASSSTIQFLGPATAYVTGATTFNILTSNASSSTTELILESNVSAAIVNMTNGNIITGTNTLTITNTRTGNGHIYGNIQRIHSFTTGVAYAFEGPNNTINFSAVSAVTSVTVHVAKGAIADFPYGSSIARLYDIQIPVGTYTASLRLHYEDDELNGNTENDMALWKYDGTQWLPFGKTANNSSTNYIEQSGITSMTGRWTMSINPSVVLWNGSVSTDWNTAANWTVYVGSASTPPSASDVAVMGGIPGGYQPTISTAVTIKNLVFVAPQAITLSMASGGSLTSGDVLGVWTSNVTHALNSDNGQITINGNLSLSDGVSGHAINLNIGSGTVTVLGSMTQSGGANINFSSAGTMNLHKNFEHSSGVFTAGTGTVIYNGDENQHVAHFNYNNLTINKASGIATIDSTTNVTGNLLISSGELDNSSSATIAGNVTIATGATFQNTGMLHVGGNWTNNGNYVGLGAHLKFNGSGTQTISATTFNNVVIDKPVGSLAILTGNMVINGDLTVTSGTFDIKTFDCNRSTLGGVLTLADAATFIVGANNAPLNFSEGNLSASSTVIADGTNSQNIYGVDFGNLTFRNGGVKTLVTPITVKGTLTIESGATFDGGAETLTLNGNWVNNGTFTPSASIVLASGTAKTITGNTIFNRLTVTGSYTGLSDFTFNGLFNVTNTGSLNTGEAINSTFHGDFINSGVIIATGTTTFSGNVLQHISLINAATTVALRIFVNGTVAPIINSTSPPQFGYITINNTGGINPPVGWTVLYSLTIGSGATFNGGNSTHNILGDLTNNGIITSTGTLNFIPATSKIVNLGSNFSSSGSVVFGGAGAMTLGGTAGTFYDVTIANTNSAGITPATDWTITNDLTLSSDAILNAASHSYLLGGNWINNGTFNSSTSTVGFNGTSTQNISGASVTTFNNINAINTANPGVSVESNQNLKGILTLGSNVNFDADGTLNTAIFTLLSTADDPIQDAAIAALPAGAQVSGEVTVQRYMAKEGANNFRIYRYISSPLQNATVADIQNELRIRGNFTGSHGGTANTMFFYDETMTTDNNNDGVNNANDGYYGFPQLANTETLQPGKGYAIFIWGDVYPSTIWDVRGNINAGNQTPVTFPVTYTSSDSIENDGWNLIGNPFPSVIDWDAISGWTKENLEQSIYVRNNGLESPNFAVWNGLLGINGGSPYIPTGQSFWIKASGEGSPVLSANENVKSSGSTASFLRTQGTAIINLLRVTMVKGSVKDETAIHFRDGATIGFDNSSDSRKMFGSSFNLSSLLADNTRMAINSLPAFDCSASVKLAVENATTGIYRFDFSSLETFSGPIVITLTDKFTNQSFNVSGGGSYSFSVTTNTASHGINRFEITFSAAAPTSDFVLNATPICEGVDGIIEINNSQLNNTYTAMKSGSAIFAVAGTGGTVQILVPKDKLRVGENSFSIIATAESCSTTIERIIVIIQEKTPEITSVKSTVQCGAGQVTLTATGASQNNMYNWYESATSVTALADQHGETFITPALAAPATYYVAAFNSLGCEGARKAVTAQIVQSLEVKITQSGNSLVSNHETGNQWYFNNLIIPSATQQSIELDKSGLYKLRVTLSTCTAEAEHNFLISAAEEEPRLNASAISIYPNPVADKVRIIMHDLAYPTPVKLLNNLGQVLETTTTELDNGQYACEFDLQNLPSGIYIIRIHGNKKMIDAKLIKK